MSWLDAPKTYAEEQYRYEIKLGLACLAGMVVVASATLWIAYQISEAFLFYVGMLMMTL